MKLKTFEDEYNRTLDWLLRSICDKYGGATEEERVYALKYCYDFKKNLINKYTRFIDEDASASCHCTELMMNFSQLYSFARTYIVKAKKEKHNTAAFAIFIICQNLRYEFPKEINKLRNINIYVKPVTDKYASKHINDDGDKPTGMLTYRKINLPVYYDINADDYWVILPGYGSVNIEWDWYYVVDSYMDSISAA
jgi:hypothetical protein